MSSTNIDLVQHSDLQSVANAIKTKAGVSGSMTFPAGFISTINSIASGGYTLPTLSNAAATTDVLYPKQYIDGNGAKQTGEMTSDTSSGRVNLTPSSSTKDYAGSKYYPNSHGAAVLADDIPHVTLSQAFLGQSIGFSTASNNGVTGQLQTNPQSLAQFIRTFTVDALGGDIYRVETGGQLFSSKQNTITIPDIPFSPVGCVFWQISRDYKPGTHADNYARSLAYGYCSTTAFGDDANGNTRYFGGTYGASSSSSQAAAYSFGNSSCCMTFGGNANTGYTVTYTPIGDGTNKPVVSFCGWVVWGR